MNALSYNTISVQICVNGDPAEGTYESDYWTPIRLMTGYQDTVDPIGSSAEAGTLYQNRWLNIGSVRCLGAVDQF